MFARTPTLLRPPAANRLDDAALRDGAAPALAQHVVQLGLQAREVGDLPLDYAVSLFVVGMALRSMPRKSAEKGSTERVRRFLPLGRSPPGSSGDKEIPWAAEADRRLKTVCL